jgi:hypothetical protein
MSRIEDSKLTHEENTGLKKMYEESKAEHGDRLLTLSKDDATAKYILKQRLKELGEKPMDPSEIDRAMEEQRQGGRGQADWELFPELDGIRLTKPLPSPELWDALERFVQLKDCDLETFRKNYPDFLPVWFYPDPSPEWGPEVHRLLPDALGGRAEAEPQTIPQSGHVWLEKDQAETRLKLGGWRAWRALLYKAWRANFHLEYVVQLVSIPTTPPGTVFFEIRPVCDAQRAILAMMVEPWRARFCPKCGIPFVARKPAHKFSPLEKCFTENRRITQRASKEKMRRKKSKEKRREVLTGKAKQNQRVNRRSNAIMI